MPRLSFISPDNYLHYVEMCETLSPGESDCTSLRPMISKCERSFFYLHDLRYSVNFRQRHQVLAMQISGIGIPIFGEQMSVGVSDGAFG